MNMEWIKVTSGKTPEIGEPILIAFVFNGVKWVVSGGYGRTNENEREWQEWLISHVPGTPPPKRICYFYGLDGKEIKNVTHWMPYPEPPED